MSDNRDYQATARSYLLGALSDEYRAQFEQQLLTQDDVYEQLLAAEDELIDEYAMGRLPEKEKEMFVKHFLNSPERAGKLRFAKAFQRYAAEHAPAEVPPRHTPRSASFPWLPFFASPLRAAAVAAVVLLAAAGIWRVFFYASDVDKGLVALNNAYKQQRPLESRITKFDYAPYVTTRGGETQRVDAGERDFAERYLMDAVRDHPGPASYHALGKFYLAKKDFDKAIEQFESAVKADSNNAQFFSDRGAAYLERAKLSLNTGKGSEDLGHALEDLNKAIALNGSSLEAQFNRALCYQYMMLPNQAADAWKKYLQQDSTSAWADEARRNLALIQNEKAKTSNTEERLFAEFQTAYQNGDDDSAWEALSQSRGRAGNMIIERLLDCYVSAEANKCDVNLKQLSYAGKLEFARYGDRSSLDISTFYERATSQQLQTMNSARAKLKSGVETFNKGEFDAAIGVFSEAKSEFAKAGEPAEGLMAQSWEGYARLRVLQNQESVTLFQDVLNESNKRGYPDLKAKALNALADAKLSNNEYSEALAYASQCSRLSEELSDRPNQVRCLTQSQSLQLIFGDYRESLESMRDALTVSQDLPWQPKLIWPIYHEGALAANFLSLPASAIAYEEEALHLADASDVPLLRSRAWERLGEIYGEQKNYPAALDSGEHALSEAQNISGDLSRKNVMAHSILMLGDLNRKAGDLDKSISYYDQALALYKELHIDAYSYTTHKGKFLVLNALNETSLAAAELAIVLKLFEDNRSRIVEESNRDKFFDARQDTYDIAADFAFTKIQDERQSFNYIEASRARSLMEMMTTGGHFDSRLKSPEISLAAETTPRTLAEIQQLMPEQTQLLEYAVLPDKVLLWFVGKSEFVAKAIPIQADELAQRIRALNNLIARGPAGHNEFLTSSTDLHNYLIGPVENLLRKDRQLIIVADKSLNYLPFSALVSSSSGRYLIEDYQLEMTPSATVFIACCKEAVIRNQQRDEQVLSIGNPRFDQTRFPTLPDLPAAAREATAVAAFYARKTVLLKGDALKARIKDGLRNADVIHLATHALSDERSPLLSKLLLTHQSANLSDGSDGELSSAEIHQLKLPRARLVVLSACQTGIERAYNGEGAIGLARPFLAAHVPMVVASLWPVDSELTAELMVQFHRFRKEQKLSTVAALQQAQLAMLHNPQPAFRENNGWAAFTVIGGYATF